LFDASIVTLVMVYSWLVFKFNDIKPKHIEFNHIKFNDRKFNHIKG